MSIHVPSFARAPRAAALVSVVRDHAIQSRRRLVRAVPMMAALAAAGVIFAARPTTIEAVPASLACFEEVSIWAVECNLTAITMSNRFGCAWTASLGLLRCGILAASRLGLPQLY